MENKEKDKFDLALDVKLEELKVCQKNHNTDSCLKCDKVIGCELRAAYVKAAYETMSKGSGGGFEF